MNEFLDKYGTDTTTNFQLMRWANELNISPFYYCMRDEINDLKYMKDQIGDTLQGDLDMNNFTITNLKSPENDNDAVHKKYLREQINSIEVNKNHLEDKISNVKRFFKRQLNNKNVVNDTKLQQEVKSFIQKELVNVANKTELQNLISLISKLEDKIAKQKLDIQQLIDNIPDENEDTFQQN
ncbi:hypothetical protein LOTGIDRAFT_175034 [Lottia gigantea]|uniref:Uncharacterized protein n=1 Tax=Lottia gigantea TaxID=225164 RepID=V4AME7_LOTGI|nr:hypothetical protein LOTGIDRAFT_175034 [Lottia gigantea]ESO95925.1 hypothetical protein LOTGIDRAFT_175034 [Lottia gigantea]